VFKTKPAFRRALEGYLLLDMPGFKTVERMQQTEAIVVSPGPFGPEISQGHIDDGRESYLKLLETVVRHLGSSVRAKYNSREARVVEVLPPLPSKFLQMSSQLGK
jgi:hypothetical protein